MWNSNMHRNNTHLAYHISKSLMSRGLGKTKWRGQPRLERQEISTGGKEKVGIREPQRLLFRTVWVLLAYKEGTGSKEQELQLEQREQRSSDTDTETNENQNSDSKKLVIQARG